MLQKISTSYICQVKDACRMTIDDEVENEKPEEPARYIDTPPPQPRRAIMRPKRDSLMAAKIPGLGSADGLQVYMKDLNYIPKKNLPYFKELIATNTH